MPRESRHNGATQQKRYDSTKIARLKKKARSKKKGATRQKRNESTKKARLDKKRRDSTKKARLDKKGATRQKRRDSTKKGATRQKRRDSTKKARGKTSSLLQSYTNHGSDYLSFHIIGLFSCKFCLSQIPLF